MIYRASEWRVLSLRFRASRLDSFRGQFFGGERCRIKGHRAVWVPVGPSMTDRQG